MSIKSLGKKRHLFQAFIDEWDYFIYLFIYEDIFLYFREGGEGQRDRERES